MNVLTIRNLWICRINTKYHNRKKYIKLIIKNIKNGKIDIIPINNNGTKNKELITYKIQKVPPISEIIKDVKFQVFNFKNFNLI